MRAIFFIQVFDELGIPLDKKWKDFSKKEKELILNGSGDQRYRINWGRHGSSLSRFEGILNSLMRRFKNTKSDGMKRWYSQFLATAPCLECAGSRLCKKAVL